MVNPQAFIHPDDRTALENLEAIPGFAQLVRKIMAMGFESYQYGINMASTIRLSPRQLPEIYKHLPPIVERLGISEPELYLQMDPNPNAWTYGDTRIFITLTSGLIECMTEEELDAVIAHECGHILCHHVLYHTVADIIKNCADALGVLGNLIIPIQFALFYWYRMSELSCDRAAAIVTSPEIVTATMARLSGGPKEITARINFEEWAKQADAYEQIRQSGTWSKTLQTLAVLNLDHPFSAVRVREIRAWCRSEAYQRIKQGALIGGQGLRCPKCSAQVGAGWKFCRHCGAKLS